MNSNKIPDITIIENAKVNKGTIYVVPRTNNSAFSHNDPQEASPQRFHIKTKMEKDGLDMVPVQLIL